jgi:hypothetical protein
MLPIFGVIFVVRGKARAKWIYSARNIEKFEKLPFAVSLITVSTLDVLSCC